eukprot:COSAG06_NODE_7132_length_2618_cov_3.130607_2_plen_72_part_00
MRYAGRVPCARSRVLLKSIHSILSRPMIILMGQPAANLNLSIVSVKLHCSHNHGYSGSRTSSVAILLTELG